MRFCVNGIMRAVVVDDHFPVARGTNNIQFSQAVDRELWVMLLEKGWAKVNQSYENTIAGLTKQALKALSGAPTLYFNHSQYDVNSMWKFIKKADERQYVICCSVGDEDFAGEHQQEGLVTNHAYSLIGAYEVKTRSGSVKLVKIRNPWGNWEWNGDWSDDSPKWN